MGVGIVSFISRVASSPVGLLGFHNIWHACAIRFLELALSALIVALANAVCIVGLTRITLIFPVALAIVFILDFALIATSGANALTSLIAVLLVSSAVEVPVTLA